MRAAVMLQHTRAVYVFSKSLNVGLLSKLSCSHSSAGQGASTSGSGSGLPARPSRTCSCGTPPASALPVMSAGARGLTGDTARKPKPKAKIGKKTNPAPGQRNSDSIGPPDTESNLRPIKFHIPADETVAARQFRELREDTQRWNQEFWAQHNRNFVKQKETFIESKLSELRRRNPHDEDRRLTAEELSVFYKQFLDNNYENHKQYNREWYGRNIGLLGPALRVFMKRFFTRGR